MLHTLCATYGSFFSQRHFNILRHAANSHFKYMYFDIQFVANL